MAKINDISNRFYGLSPAVEFGGDRECTNHDFYQTENEAPVEIGKLGYGTRVNHKLTKLPYIIINIEKQEEMKKKIVKKIDDTIKLMYNTSSPYLFRLLNHYEDEHNVFLIMEAYEGETLEQKLLKENQFDVNSTIKYLKQVAIGIKKLHSNQIYNISILPETILLGECLKLTDYGLKMNAQTDKEPLRPTFQIKNNNITHTITPYTSPEELDGILNKTKPSLNAKTDSWNLGILMYEMLTGFKSPFKGDTIEHLCEGIKNCEIDLTNIEDELCRLLIEKLLKKEKDERLDIDQFFELEFIKSVDIEEPIIDLHDNIINPQNEENYKQDNNEYGDDNDNQVMQSLKFENENLRKKIEQLEMQMNVDEEDTPKKKNKVIKNESAIDEQNDNNNKVDNENEKDETLEQGITDEDLENKEKQLDEMLKQQNENEDNDSQKAENDLNTNSDELSDINEDDDEITLQKKILKLRTKYTMLKDEMKEKHKKKKDLENIYTQTKKEYDTILQRAQSQQNNETQTKEQQEHKKNIKDISTKIQTSINNFNTSQCTFKDIVDKLIKSANALHNKAMNTHNENKEKKMNDYKQLIDNNMDLFNSRKEKIEEQKQNDEKMIEELNEKIRNGYQSMKELNQYKNDYEMSLVKENEAEKKIEFFKKKNESDQMLIELYNENTQNYRYNLDCLDAQKCTVINTLNKTKQFIQNQLPDLYEEYETLVQLEKTF